MASPLNVPLGDQNAGEAAVKAKRSWAAFVFREGGSRGESQGGSRVGSGSSTRVKFRRSSIDQIMEWFQGGQRLPQAYKTD